MTWLRTLMLLALIVWIGGIVFFAFVLAPTVFSVLPSRELAGNVVNPSLAALHRIGIASGLVFLAASLLLDRIRYARFKPLTLVHVLAVLMLALTLVSQYAISPRMRSLRAEMGVIDNVPFTDARRVEFNRLHQWSTRTEGGVLLLGLAVVVLTARRWE
jgi:DMSO/TMAO reductase YedYZ heme-binding membrane subunit